MLLAGVTGCSTRKRLYKHHAFVTEADAYDYLTKALQSELPDVRREAIREIARSRYATHEVVVRALATIALTDPSPSVQCAALAALRAAGGPEAAEAVLAVLEQEPGAGEAPWIGPRGANVRLAALRTALTLVADQQLAPENRAALQALAARLIREDPSRDIRQCSARVLGYCPHADTLEPLIDALQQRDFGVVYEAEQSLMRLTGRTFDYDAVAWREWLTGTDQPFADAGRLDHLVEPPPKNWWQRSLDGTRRAFETFKPKKGES